MMKQSTRQRFPCFVTPKRDVPLTSSLSLSDGERVAVRPSEGKLMGGFRLLAESAAGDEPWREGGPPGTQQNVWQERIGRTGLSALRLIEGRCDLARIGVLLV